MSNTNLYLYSRYGRGQKSGSLLPVGRQSSRISNYKRSNNIYESPIINNNQDIKKTLIHNKALLMVDKSFEIRYLPLLKHLIDIGYIPNSIDIKVLNDDINSIETEINDYYNNGGRLFFGTQNSSVFFKLTKWFETHSDAIYFNSGSRIWITRIDNEIPDNMISTTCNHLNIVKFIFDNIICNIHKHMDFLLGSSFDNIFDFVNDSLHNGQVFNQIIYVSDNSDLRLKNNFIKTLQDYIQTNFSKDTDLNEPVTLKTFVLNNNSSFFPDELDKLLTENQLNSSSFASSTTKSIFIFDCFDSSNCQNMLNYFSKKEYYNNLIIFNEKFLNLNINDKTQLNTKFNFPYSFILSLNYSELGYKTSRQLFNDYNTPLPFIDIFSNLLDIFERIINSNNQNPVTRLIEYLTNSFSIDRNEWHVKPLYLYGIKERYNESLGVWNFYSSTIIFKKSFNDTNTGTSTLDESWIDTAISEYSSAPGNVTYSTNLTNYNNSNINFFNTNLNGVSMLFSSLQEITDYTNDLDGFFKGTYKSSTYNGGANPNSTPSIFGIWKVLTNSGLPINKTAIQQININVTAPSQSLIDGTSTNKNFWYYINKGPINYTYNSYNQYGKIIATYQDTITIDLDITYSIDNYLVIFNKGDIYNGIRAPLLIYFTLFANQVNNKQYRIGDIISISSDPILGTNINASIDSISNDGFEFNVTRFENENTNGITNSVLKQNTGIVMSLANQNSISYLNVNPDITNTSNNLLNLWSLNGCYYLSLLPSGILVANDFRTGLTFWSSQNGFSNPGPSSLRFRVIELNTTYYIQLHLLDTIGTERTTIISNSINSNLLIYPLQLLVTNDRNISIINSLGNTLWSQQSNINLFLNNNSTIINSNNYGSIYSLNGLYNLSLSSNGTLSFKNVINNKIIYSISNSSASYLKFSYTNNTFTLGLYNSSNIQIYNILNDGTFTSSTTFDIENNKLSILPFIAPYTFKISNNGDLIIVDANNNKCWNLGKADKGIVTQDSYEIINGLSTLVNNNITGLTSVHPRQGDTVTVHNPINLQYSNATATITMINSDKSIKAIFYDNNDSNIRSSIIQEKPELRSYLVTDSGITTGQNFMPVSNTELFNLTSNNGYYSASIGEDCFIRVIDNRNSKQIWKSYPLQLLTGQTILKCNGLILDNDTGSLYIDVILSGVNNQEKYYVFENTNINDNSNIDSYMLIMQDDGNLCLYQTTINGITSELWCSMVWQMENWTSDQGIIQAFQYDIPNVPPRLISTNGCFYLGMNEGKLGIRSYINGNDTWLDPCFKYIGKPFFYSGQSGITATTTTGASKEVFTSGTLLQNFNNSNTKGYWNIIYNNINNTFSNSDSYNLVNDVSVIWTSANSTAVFGGSGVNSGTFNFYYKYTNITGKTIRSTIWVSVVEKCDVHISTINNNAKITTVGGGSSTWPNMWQYDFDLPSGDTTFSFLNTYNSGGRCGLAFVCFPKYISSCDLFLDKTSGNLLVENVLVLANDSTTVSVPGITNLQSYPITNILNPGPAPYILTFEDDGVGGSNGVLSINNNTQLTIFNSKANPNGIIDLVLNVPDDRNGILNQNIKLYAQQDETELESFLWSPSGYAFFGIHTDTISKTQSICIFDTRFTKPIYTFYTSTYTTLTSQNAISYLIISNMGAIIAYNILGATLWSTNNIVIINGTSVQPYTNYKLMLDDKGVLSILGNNISGTTLTLATYNQTNNNYESYILSSTTKYYNGRILTSSNGNYTLTLNNGSLNINSVTDTSYTNSNNTNVSKEINVTTLYSTLYSYTGINPSSAYITFDIDGVLRVYDSTGIKYSFGTSNIGIPGYKLILGNTGELAIYDSSISSASAIDSGSISQCPNWTTVYNKFKVNTNSYAWNNYRWIWNTKNSYNSALYNTTVNFYTTYTNTRTTDIAATLWCSVDDQVDIYMNGNKLANNTTVWNTLFSNTITLKAGTTSFFKFIAKNGGSSNNPAGLIFWCLENNNTNDATNTLFFSNSDTVYCSDNIIIGPSDFGIQTWSSGTAYSEIIPYPNYTIDTSDIPENQLISNEYNFKIVSASDDTEEYTKLYSPNRLYYLRLEINGTLSIYLSSSDKRIWCNNHPYNGTNNAFKIGFVYDSNGNGVFGLWDSKNLSYGNQTITVIKNIIYIFYLGNDRILRLVGSDGSSVIFNP